MKLASPACPGRCTPGELRQHFAVMPVLTWDCFQTYRIPSPPREQAYSLISSKAWSKPGKIFLSCLEAVPSVQAVWCLPPAQVKGACSHQVPAKRRGLLPKAQWSGLCGAAAGACISLWAGSEASSSFCPFCFTGNANPKGDAPSLCFAALKTGEQLNPERAFALKGS